jgi:hypothetical protein
MKSKSISPKILLDVGNASARCAMCRDAMSGQGLGKKAFQKVKSLAKRTAVRLTDLSKDEKDVLKQAGKMIMSGEKPKEVLEGTVKMIADKFAKKLAGKGYQCGSGFSSTVGREFNQAQQGSGVFDDLLGVMALMDPTGLVRTGVIAKEALGLGKEGAGVNVTGERVGRGVNVTGEKIGRGVNVTGQVVGRGQEQDGEGFLGIDWLPRPSQVADTVAGAVGVPKGIASGLLKTVGLGKEKKPRKPSKWIMHVKAYAKANGCSYKEAMSRAKETYKK